MYLSIYGYLSSSWASSRSRLRNTASRYVIPHRTLIFTSPRLAGIEEAQRETCRERKRQKFSRFARRKWLACDRAAESVQRVFRGYVGRKRARLTAEVRRLTGKADKDWVEVSSAAGRRGIMSTDAVYKRSKRREPRISHVALFPESNLGIDRQGHTKN